MSENWERGLDVCKGEFIIALGDDDALMPDALAYADLVLRSPEIKVLNFGWHYYYWPQALAPWLRGRILVASPHSSKDVVCYDARATLREAMAFTRSPYFNPNIYSSFVHRSIIEKCKEKLGMYFAHRVPDFFTGFVNCYFSQYIHEFSRPLGVRGISRTSNGGGLIGFDLGGKEVLDRCYDEPVAQAPAQFGDMEKVYLPMSIMVEVFSHAKSVLFPEWEDVAFNYRHYALSAVQSVNRSSGGYEVLVEEVKRVARRYGIDMSDIPFPPKLFTDAERVAEQGPQYDQSGKCTRIAIDGMSCGITNVAEAVKLIAAVMPR